MNALDRRLEALGGKPVHAARIARAWLRGEFLTELDAPADRPLPVALRAGLVELERELERLLRVESEHPAGDGATRLLLRLSDGARVESVLLPRDGLCVSTQIGCAVGCTFCTTGLGGLERRLTTLEILAQVVLARRTRTVRRCVFMGMGEPAHNLEAVLGAIHALGTHGGIGHKQLVFSTVGERRAFDALHRNEIKPALALSLHTTDADLRVRLLPRAPRFEPRELLELGLDYSDRIGHPLQLQWTLLAGVNDDDEQLERLIEWTRGRRVAVNYIPFNPGPGLEHARPTAERAHVMTRRLHAAGIIAKLRRSAATEVDGACGQLRARRSAELP